MEFENVDTEIAVMGISAVQTKRAGGTSATCSFAQPARSYLVSGFPARVALIICCTGSVGCPFTHGARCVMQTSFRSY